ncbi:hypothetical protein ABK040_001780 [Willaertia magna]
MTEIELIIKELFNDTNLTVLSVSMFTLIASAIRNHVLEKKSAQNESRREEDDIIRENIQHMDIKTAISIPIVGSISLILLYFLLGTLRNLLLILICLFGTYSIHFSISPLLDNLQLPIFGMKKSLYFFTLSYQQIISIFLSSLIVLHYLFTEHWLSNNIIGICLTITYLCLLKLPNIKIALLLLISLFIYDIYWVFYSPTHFGKSVMVEVAKNIELPVRLLFPRGEGYAMLGLGDLVLPGLLLGFLYRYDVLMHRELSFNGYYLISYICYGLGLIFAELAIVIYRTGQPALLYLVPTTLLPLITIGYLKKELRTLWNGPNFESFEQPTHKEDTTNDIV